MNARYFNKLVRIRDLRPRDVVYGGGAFPGMPAWPLVVKRVERQNVGTQMRRHLVTFADGTKRSVESDTLIQIHRARDRDIWAK